MLVYFVCQHRQHAVLHFPLFRLVLCVFPFGGADTICNHRINYRGKHNRGDHWGDDQSDANN